MRGPASRAASGFRAWRRPTSGPILTAPSWCCLDLLDLRLPGDQTDGWGLVLRGVLAEGGPMSLPTVAALYVQTGGTYFGLEGVEPWDEERDARLYPGPYPCVAHPPCARWCRLAGLVEKRWGYRKGDDGGTFAAALASVRAWGGVLEHPAYSDAFAHFGLPAPKDKGGWQMGLCGGWSCHVEQWHYGHAAKKATWLYCYGVRELPSLRWGATPDNIETAYVTDGGGDVKRRRARAPVSWCGNHVKDGENRRRLGGKEASSTPIEFRDTLIAMARSVKPVELQGHRERSATPPAFRDELLSMARSVK